MISLFIEPFCFFMYGIHYIVLDLLQTFAYLYKKKSTFYFVCHFYSNGNSQQLKQKPLLASPIKNKKKMLCRSWSFVIVQHSFSKTFLRSNRPALLYLMNELGLGSEAFWGPYQTFMMQPLTTKPWSKTLSSGCRSNGVRNHVLNKKVEELLLKATQEAVN